LLVRTRFYESLTAEELTSFAVTGELPHPLPNRASNSKIACERLLTCECSKSRRSLKFPRLCERVLERGAGAT
jgi:hypothetical protein